MDKSVLHKYTNRTDPESAGSTVLDLETDDLGCFGWLRGARDRSLMLELRRKTGNVTALGYAWLHRIDFDPSEGITLWFAGQKVVLRGQNLNAEVRPTVRLLDGIVRHRVTWIQEASGADMMDCSEGRCFVEAIDW